MQKRTDEEIIERAKELFPTLSHDEVVEKMAEHNANGKEHECCGNCSGSCASHA